MIPDGIHTIDTHSHFNLEQFAGDRGEAIERMAAAGIGTITVGIDVATSVLAVSIARVHDNIWACVGQHPTEWSTPFEAIDFRQLLDQRSVDAQGASIVAIGECGLDYYRDADRAAKTDQKLLFAAQIALAQEYDLPLMLHIRPQAGTMDAYEDALAILEQAQTAGAAKVASDCAPLRGTAHFFVGDTVIADRFLALGFYISFSGVITFASEYEEVVRHVPLDRILSETDAPFAAPVPYRGKRNEPAFVGSVVAKIANLKGVPEAEARSQLRHNAEALFGI